MKTITIDFDTYQNELVQAKLSGQTEAVQKFKAELLSRLDVRNAPIEKAIKFGVPPANLNQAKEAGAHWFKNNFTDDELVILFNK